MNYHALSPTVPLKLIACDLYINAAKDGKIKQMLTDMVLLSHMKTGMR